MKKTPLHYFYKALFLLNCLILGVLCGSIFHNPSKWSLILSVASLNALSAYLCIRRAYPSRKENP